MRRAWSLVHLYAPVAFLAFWHWWDWGGTFGSRSGLWTRSARAAMVLLAGITLWLVSMGPACSGSRLSFKRSCMAFLRVWNDDIFQRGHQSLAAGAD